MPVESLFYRAPAVPSWPPSPVGRDQPGDPIRNAPGPLVTARRLAYRPFHLPRQQMRAPTSDRQHTPHLDAGTPTGNAHTKNTNGVRAGRRPPPIAGQEARCRIWLFQINRLLRRQARCGPCPRCFARCGPIVAGQDAARSPTVLWGLLTAAAGHLIVFPSLLLRQGSARSRQGPQVSAFRAGTSRLSRQQ